MWNINKNLSNFSIQFLKFIQNNQILFLFLNSFGRKMWNLLIFTLPTVSTNFSNMAISCQLEGWKLEQKRSIYL